MGNVTQLKDKDNNKIYPITSEELVFDSNGASLKDKIGLKADVGYVDSELNKKSNFDHNHKFIGDDKSFLNFNDDRNNTEIYSSNFTVLAGGNGIFLGDNAKFINETWYAIDKNRPIIVFSASGGKMLYFATDDFNEDGTVKSWNMALGEELASQKYVNEGLDKKSDIHGHPYKDINYIPNWNEISGKPNTFVPSTHNHDELYATKSEVAAIRNELGSNKSVLCSELSNLIGKL